MRVRCVRSCRLRASCARRRHVRAVLSFRAALLRRYLLRLRRSRRRRLRGPDLRQLKALPDGRPYSIGNDIAWRPSIHNDAALWFLLGERSIGLPKLLVKLERFSLEAIGRILSAPAFCTCQADLRRNVKNECEFGKGRANRHAFETADQALIDISQDALVHAR